MQKRTLSLIIGTALAMPSIAMAAPMDQGDITPADMRATPAPNTLQAEIEGPDGELLATQPGEVETDVNVTDMNDPNMMGSPDEMSDPNMMDSSITPADMRATPAPNTLQAEIEGPDGELLATQPGEIESDVDVTETNHNDMNDPNMMGNPDEMANPISEQAAPQALNQQHSNNEYQPLIAGEVVSDEANATNVPVTLQEKTKDNRGELLATQPAEVEFSENRRVVPR
ncbi:hypothetical protein [uncultured Psychrobacter sp.]|uniref:hypothetical protein n=1 Tax=uncultured Psychrobacter sp. TaxID=259303 RepID=UPI0026191F5B|nr:hypothetical protein [uncultured Psychrobacter sp.]